MLYSFATSALLLASVGAASAIEKRAPLDNFVTKERAAALAGVLANIGPDGRLATNASRGVVIAGPGILNPDYRYSWTRDSAMTLKAVAQEFYLGGNDGLSTTITDYIYAEAVRQTTYNPMGPLLPFGTGLGEAKFQINLTRFNGVWGRPQRDGPALRAITLMEYVNYLMENGHEETAKTTVWPLINNDLSYVAQYWNSTGYDLWEEVAGTSFFTVLAQYRALVQGNHIANKLGESCPGCIAEQRQVACFIANNFWEAEGGYIRSNINGGLYRSGIDSNSLLGPMEIFDIRGSCDDTSYQPCSSRVLATHKVYVDSFRAIYPINANSSNTSAIATGRYPEDSYYGGNPWYICTLASAEVLYDAAAQFRFQASLTIDSTSLAFFQGFYPSAKVGSYAAPASAGKRGKWGVSSYGQKTFGSPAVFTETNEFTKIVTAMVKYADGFVAVAETYTPANGSLSEQYNRTSGEPLSAWALTWSFASFVSMAQRRSGQYPATWHPNTNRGVAKNCKASDGTQGTYAAAIAAGAPAVDTSCTVQIQFNVNASTTFGENVYIAGNISSLGNYAPGYAPMVPPNYPIWYYIIDAPPNTVINYKYVHQESASYVLENVNRTITTPACGNGRVQIETHDSFAAANITVTENFCNADVNHCW